MSEPRPPDEIVAQEEEVFYDALQFHDAAERAAFLQTACKGDPRLRGAVDDLLAGHQRAQELFRASSAALSPPSFLFGPAAPGASRDSHAGTKIGGYRLLQKLGEGGSGEVFLALQETPVRREVALKILKLGMDTKRVISRFEAERQTLAMMEHPNIAHVLDAGATESGRPYFVMELVRGTKITDFCEQHQLSLPDRLRLFQRVCLAIQHAHQKGVIHRDLKPSNILIAQHDGVPTPKVIDFGIAKATAAPAGSGQTTICDQMIGTPAYMSPEQAQGGWGDLDTRSDVYSLGVVLYELLAGRPPFRNEELLSGGIEEMRWRLHHEEPARPSLLAERAKGEHPIGARESDRWAHALRGDLDWIAMKALEKDREQRYQTVRGLWLDLERYLTNQPVEARPPGGLYRLRKMVRRNRMLFTALGSTALALVAGLAVSTWLYFKATAAERQQNQLRSVAEHALQQEEVLRRRAEDRERFTNAAILILQRRYGEADSVIGQLSGLPSAPSVEAANVFRALAEWHVLQGDFPLAVHRALQLLEVNRFDESDQTDVVTRDLVIAAPTLVEAGELDRYATMRARALEKFANTASPVAAEQVMKMSLLQPAGPEILEACNRLAQLQEKCESDGRASIVNRAWGSAVVGLLELRRGNFVQSYQWCERSRSFPYRNKAHEALCMTVEARARWELREESAARALLSQAEQMVDGWFARPYRSAEAGAWNDWLIARILLREAKLAMMVER